jgi:hypothetical protein
LKTNSGRGRLIYIMGGEIPEPLELKSDIE